jgi:protein ImuB
VFRSGSEPVAPWPGTVPGPSPARVFDPPRPADLIDADGQAITVSGRGEPSAAPAALRCAALPNGGGPLVAWAGPWPHDLRWWDRGRLRAGTEGRLRAGAESSRGSRRRALWQVVVDGGGGTAIACLVAVSRGRAEIEAIYD